MFILFIYLTLIVSIIILIINYFIKDNFNNNKITFKSLNYNNKDNETNNNKT